eukprot:scaffold29956_cov47-Phaeocystis_antarctica.AAC.2
MHVAHPRCRGCQSHGGGSVLCFDGPCSMGQLGVCLRHLHRPARPMYILISGFVARLTPGCVPASRGRARGPSPRWGPTP